MIITVSTFKVTSSQTMSKPLTYFQKLVCKWFKITPETTFLVSVLITVDKPVPIGSLLTTYFENTWKVIGVDDKNKQLLVINERPLLSMNNNGLLGELCAIFIPYTGSEAWKNGFTL